MEQKRASHIIVPSTSWSSSNSKADSHNDANGWRSAIEDSHSFYQRSGRNEEGYLSLWRWQSTQLYPQGLGRRTVYGGCRTRVPVESADEEVLAKEGLTCDVTGILAKNLVSEHSKVLGIHWDTKSDCFLFNPIDIIKAAEEIGENPTKMNPLWNILQDIRSHGLSGSDGAHV